ncbi:uncharacterized protein [Onthophagus taurus]|uniref:uncharacterized protein isoform X1 n=1 Tax=Onthophagus taurus TaxID=166361 RepID=UPI0039BE4152
MVYQNRIYLPSEANGIETNEYLQKFVKREFPSETVHSVPKSFQKSGEKQAILAEKVIFDRLRGLKSENRIKGLWLIFFHSASYAGRSFRNQRDGKLMIREHDFVLFIKYHNNIHVVLIEVKSTHDSNASIKDLEVTSDAKVIKNNKRSAQHQLRDHLEVLLKFLGISEQHAIQMYIMWPFLSSLTRDPKHQIIKRWKDEPNLHVFEETLSKQEYFNQWFLDYVLTTKSIGEDYFNTLLNRYIVLSCGVFVDEINEGMLALLNQEQLELLNSNVCKMEKGKPLVVHGAAGTGKTLLILKKLEELFYQGRLNDENRALYICYWPGIRCEVEEKLKILKIKQFVDTTRFYISQSGFMRLNERNYKHVFMDEAEAICLAFDKEIMTTTLSTIFQKYQDGNKISHINQDWGELWFLVDMHQASLFLPRHSPNLLKTPSIILSKVMRSTGYIFNIFKQFYSNPMPNLPQKILNNINIPNISLGHHISGPPIFWLNTDLNRPKRYPLNLTVKLIIDLCGSKGFKPNDICIIPFFLNDSLNPKVFNEEIDRHFVENGYRPRAVGEIETFITKKGVNDFLISWALKTKGIEFTVVVLVFDEDDYDTKDCEDRKRTYIMASRCTSMLIFVCPEKTKNEIDIEKVFREYPFSV